MTSDAAKGLCRHVKTDLGAHSSPDLFHVQHEVAKAMSLNLARQVKQAEQAVAAATDERERQRCPQAAYQAQCPRPSGRPPAFAQRIEQAHTEQLVAELNLENARTQQHQARTLLHELRDVYHPYALNNGQAQSNTITAKVEALNLAPEIETAVYASLISAVYLDQVAAKTTDRERRQRLHTQAADLLAPLNASGSVVASLTQHERHELEQLAHECAGLFQRASSCVEGRNGQLALHHHSRRRLSDRKLAALTAVHNYHSQRPDKLFDWVLDKLVSPGRPAKKRHRPAKPSCLHPLAT